MARLPRARRVSTAALHGGRESAAAILVGTIALFGSAAGAEPVTAEAAARTLAELTRPSSTIELGPGLVGHSAPTLRNSLGLRHDGLLPLGQLDLRGRQYSYGNPADDLTRWRVSASSMPLRPHDLAAEYGRQGWYRFSFAYDDRRHYTSDG